MNIKGTLKAVALVIASPFVVVGFLAGARVAMQHRWRLFGIHALARDLFEADMMEGSYYGLIVEALDHAFSLDIRDMGDWAEERRCD